MIVAGSGIRIRIYIGILYFDLRAEKAGSVLNE